MGQKRRPVRARRDETRSFSGQGGGTGPGGLSAVAVPWRSAIRAPGWVAVALLLVINGCALSAPWQAPSRAHAAGLTGVYPEAFMADTIGVGLGLCQAGRDSAVAHAAHMALASLRHMRAVHVVGERLVEPMPNGFVVFCGESVQVGDGGTIDPDSCRLDTAYAADHVWVCATAGPVAGPGRIRFRKPASLPPAWVQSTPVGDGYRYTVASVAADSANEPEAWQAAQRRALVDLAFATSAVASAPRPALDRSLVGVQTLRVDARVNGFRVAARWRDAKRVYVLARIPVPAVEATPDGTGR